MATKIDARIFPTAIEYAKRRMTQLRSSHGWDHVQRVTCMAERIAEAEGADPHIVRCAAILHDIARADEDASNGAMCHAQRGSELAREFLSSLHVDPSNIARIAACIAEHRYRGGAEPDSIESRVLFDADKLDSIGAIGIGRAFLFSGEIGARLHNEDADIDATRAYTEEDTAYREFVVKLRHIRAAMLTDTGRAIAEERHRFMEDFFERLQREAHGHA